MAEPPQMEEPTPTRVEILAGTCMALFNRAAMHSEVAMVAIMIGRDCLPVSRITFRFSPNPIKITAYCRIFLEVMVMPAWIGALFYINKVRSIPSKMAITGPPIMGNLNPRK